MTNPAKKFRKLAKSLQKKIDAKRADRLTNTAKRMREWESAIKDALHLELLQDKLDALADAHDNDCIPFRLRKVKDKTQIECLLRYEQMPTQSDDKKRMEKAGIVEEFYAEAREALLAMGNPNAGKEDDAIKLKRIEMDVDNSRILGYFPTPEAVIREMLGQVNVAIGPGDYILEPSAGKGSIADVLAEEYPDAVIHCIEWNHSLREILELKDYTVICDDIFDENLTAYHNKYKLIVMNPPWGKEYGPAEDARHILHCYENFLADDGQLISICSESAFSTQYSEYEAFREQVAQHGWHVNVAPGAFKEADRSTGVSVRIVVLSKADVEQQEPDQPAYEFSWGDWVRNTKTKEKGRIERITNDGYKVDVYGHAQKRSYKTTWQHVDLEPSERVPMKRLLLDSDLVKMRADAAGAKNDLNVRKLGYAEDNEMLDNHILGYAALRARRCLPVFTAKLIGLPEEELQRLVDDKRLATVQLRTGQTAYHITWQGAAQTIYLWGHLKPRIDTFRDGYIREPEGISESIIRDLEEAISLMKELHDVNSDKPLSGFGRQQDVEPQRVFIPHLDEHGTVREILNDGKALRIMTDGGQAIQTRTISTEPYIKEVPTVSPSEPVRNSPIDDSPKEDGELRQLVMF